MRRVPFSALFLSFLLVGLLVPKPWAEIGQAQAASGVVMKCVGFNAFTDIEARVYLHNDGPKSLVVRVRFLGPNGNTLDFVGPLSILPGHTTAVGRAGKTGLSTAIMAAKITSSEESLIVDAERVVNINPFQHRRHITCTKSDAAPDTDARGG